MKNKPPLVRTGQGDYEQDWEPGDGLIVGILILAVSAVVSVGIIALITYAMVRFIKGF